MAHTPSLSFARIRQRLEDGYWPRVHCALIVTLSGAAAFLTSVVLLAAGISTMAVRYGIAALAGYGAFLAIIRLWVGWKWSRFVDETGDDLVDVVTNSIDLPLPRGGGKAVETVFRGGRSGGGGASASWSDSAQPAVVIPPPASAPSAGSGHAAGGFSLDLGGDDLFWLVVALAAAGAGLAAVIYVIYVAPALLAEAVMNAAIAGKVYHGLKRRDSEHWTSNVFRRTAVAATVVFLSAVVAGYALQRVAPEARSVGGVWLHIRSH